MANTVTAKDIDELWLLLRERLAGSPYADTYDAEPALTSHAIHGDRSADAWQLFCKEGGGPDVNVLGSNNRLDIVLRHPELGSIGIEVKCLSANGHAGKLTQGLGQALLGLANRDRTMLVIHCGTVDVNERQRLRQVGDRICAGLKTCLVVVP